MDIIQLFGYILAITLIQLGLDFKSISAARRIQRLSNAYTTQTYTPSVTVIIKLDRSAESIFALLDQLYDQEYSNLQVIIHISHTAGKYAQPKLVAQRRKKHFTQLRLIKHTKGMTADSILRRYATGEFVMYMTTGEALSSNFFTFGAKELLDTNIDGLEAQRQIRIDQTILSAYQAIEATVAHVQLHLGIRQPANIIKTAVLYRRHSLLTKPLSELRIRYGLRNTVTIPRLQYWKLLARKNRTIKPRRDKVKMTSIMSWVVGGILLAGLLFSTREYINIPALLLLSYITLLATAVLSQQSQSFYSKLTIMLFIPISPIFLLIISVIKMKQAVLPKPHTTWLSRKRRLVPVK